MTHFRRSTLTELDGLSLGECEDLKRDELNKKMLDLCCFAHYWIFYGYLEPAFFFSKSKKKKCFFRASRKAKPHMFPLASTIVSPTRDNDINSKFVIPLLLQTCRGPCIL